MESFKEQNEIWIWYRYRYHFIINLWKNMKKNDFKVVLFDPGFNIPKTHLNRYIHVIYRSIDEKIICLLSVHLVDDTYLLHSKSSSYSLITTNNVSIFQRSSLLRNLVVIFSVLPFYGHKDWLIILHQLALKNHFKFSTNGTFRMNWMTKWIEQDVATIW